LPFSTHALHLFPTISNGCEHLMHLPCALRRSFVRRFEALLQSKQIAHFVLPSCAGLGQSEHFRDRDGSSGSSGSSGRSGCCVPVLASVEEPAAACTSSGFNISSMLSIVGKN
jgi:hypothetical protein